MVTVRAPRQARLVFRDGRQPDIVRIDDPHAPWRDLYHRLLTISWLGFIGLMGLIYLAVNALFALAYCLDPGAIANSTPGSFVEAFFFSVQTMASIGYGAMYPQTLYAHCLVVMEAFVGLLFVAVATGMSFARFSLPSARIMFSNYAVVTQHETIPTLMFRAANQRRNRILEAQLWVSLVWDETTAEGEFFRRFYDLKMTRSHTPLFGLTWTAMHPIDSNSPLFGESPTSLAQRNAEIIVILTGIDETISQTIHARHSFVAEEVIWDHRFADILGWTSDNRRCIDFSKFDKVEPLALPRDTPPRNTSHSTTGLV